MFSEFSTCNDSSTVSKTLEELQIIHVVLSVVNTRHRFKKRRFGAATYVWCRCNLRHVAATYLTFSFAASTFETSSTVELRVLGGKRMDHCLAHSLKIVFACQFFNTNHYFLLHGLFFTRVNLVSQIMTK